MAMETVPANERANNSPLILFVTCLLMFIDWKADEYAQFCHLRSA